MFLVLPFVGCYIVGLMQYVDFQNDFFLSDRNIHLKFIHVFLFLDNSSSFCFSIISRDMVIITGLSVHLLNRILVHMSFWQLWIKLYKHSWAVLYGYKFSNQLSKCLGSCKYLFQIYFKNMTKRNGRFSLIYQALYC